MLKVFNDAHTKKLLVNLCTWSCQRLRPVKQTGYFPLACQLGFVDLLSYTGLQEICLLEINIFVCKLFKPNIFFFSNVKSKATPTNTVTIHPLCSEHLFWVHADALPVTTQQARCFSHFLRPLCSAGSWKVYAGGFKQRANMLILHTFFPMPHVVCSWTAPYLALSATTQLT